jgi:hypothetical protein
MAQPFVDPLANGGLEDFRVVGGWTAGTKLVQTLPAIVRGVEAT